MRRTKPPFARSSPIRLAIVDIDNEVHGIRAMPAGVVVPPDGILRTQLMEVVARHGDRWLVEAYHNVDLKAPAAGSVAR
jgi:hypothetical protein